MSPDAEKPVATRRTVCDHCRRRRIRCDGRFPCNQCESASLTCKREHVPKRRGPKRGSGRVINELRALNAEGRVKGEVQESGSKSTISDGSQSLRSPSIDRWISENDASNSPTSSQHPWFPVMPDGAIPFVDEPTSFFTSDHFRPSEPGYFHLIPICLDLFMEHIYPIMPLIHFPTLQASIHRPLEMYEKNLLYSLCALTSTHMSGKSIVAPGPPSWEAAGCYFLAECMTIRQNYDFVEDKSLYAVISSYFVSTAFFEIGQNRKSWYYLREALTMGQDLGIHDEHSFIGLSSEEALCRRRTFWILYITERSFAILRHKPLTLSKTPSFPTTLHEYETPEIHTGFMHLIDAYHCLDSSFVDSWNESAAAPTSTQTYTLLQQRLNLPHPAHLSLTSIQKADLLVTQQWLRVIVWQSSMRQGLLSSSSPDESMTFRYPLQIAHSLLSVISSLPTSSIEVHGMGIFEKIFEVGNTMLDVLQACGQDFATGGLGITQDPFDLFVKTLSQTPNSQRQYANLLLAKAAEKPAVLRFSSPLMPELGGHGFGLDFATLNEEIKNGNTNALIPLMQGRQWRGSIVGEIADDGVVFNDAEEEGGDQTWTDNTIWVPSSEDDVVEMASVTGSVWGGSE